MKKQLISVAAVALTSALFSTASVAHVANGALVSGNGKAVGSAYTKCVIVASGAKSAKCHAAKPAKKAKAVSKQVSLSGDALFATNSAELSAAGKAALDAFVADTKGLKVGFVNVVGHADSRGAAAYNLDLSVRRAVTVKSYLASKGLPDPLIFASGKGETAPVASNDTAEGRAKNRRVDIKISGTK